MANCMWASHIDKNLREHSYNRLRLASARAREHGSVANLEPKVPSTHSPPSSQPGRYEDILPQILACQGNTPPTKNRCLHPNLLQGDHVACFWKAIRLLRQHPKSAHKHGLISNLMRQVDSFVQRGQSVLAKDVLTRCFFGHRYGYVDVIKPRLVHG